MATFTQEYAASADLTVTNLHSLAASATFIAGWGSGTIDNTSNKHFDKHVSCKFTIASANNQAGQIYIYALAQLDDSNFANPYSAGTPGTEGAVTCIDTEERDNALVLLYVLNVDASAGAVHYTPKLSLRSAFGGTLPPKCALYITGNVTTTTTAQLAASGNQVTVAGSYLAAA